MSAVEDFQPASATLPGVMSLSGKPEFYQVAASKRDLAARVTFIVKAFERPSCLTRLLESIIVEYPANPVVVLDDSREPVLSGPALTLFKEQLSGLRYLRTDHDVGLAAGRNTLVDAVDTPYVLLLDDDFILNDRSHIERLLDTLEWGRFDLVGGCIDSAYSYTLLHTPGQLEVRMDLPCEGWVRRPPEYDTPEMSCWEVDMINNFFLARTDFLRKVRWDPRLK
jgi:GT2 family glycosyltransferase